MDEGRGIYSVAMFQKNNHTFWCGYFFMDTVRTSHTRQK